MVNEQKRFCNQCPNHCPEDALSCGRGRAYFGISTQDNVERAQREGHEGYENHHPHDGRSQGRPGMRMESESSNPLVQSLVKAAAVAEHKSSMMRMHGKDESTMFGALSPEEQEELGFLLDKVLGAWAEEHANHHRH